MLQPFFLKPLPFLYDAKTGELIWSGKSKTLSRDSTNQLMNDVIKAVINNLQKNKLIAPK